LLGPLKTESFANDAAREVGLFHSDLRPVENGASGSASLTISYNATNQSYTVSTGGNSQTFTQTDKVNSGSTDFIAFNKASGSVNDSLSLTAPGTSGPLSYKYVGGGAWEHVTIGSSTLDFRYNPFTYGIATPAASLQRTGTGLYAVSLVGALASTKPYAMAGSGTMQVDFLNGGLTSQGALTSIDVSSGIITSLGVFYGSGTVSSSANSFSGSFAMEDGTRYTGSWQGRFYGPANEEVGAVWTLSSTSGEFAAGYMLGRSDSSVTAYNTSVLNLQFSESFAVRFSGISFVETGTNLSAASPDSPLRGNSTFSYDVTAGSYRYQDSINSIDTTFSAASLSSTKSTSAVAVYEMAAGGTNYRLTLNKAGSGNPNIAMTYASFGHWEQAQSGATAARDRWFVWGVRTNGFQIPTGTAHFDGTLTGKAVTLQGGSTYSLSGTSSFDFDFGAGSFTGTLTAIGTKATDNSTFDFGSFAVKSGAVDVDAGLSASVHAANNAYAGYFEGALFGPQAQELGGTFGFQNEIVQSWQVKPTTSYLSGVVMAKKTSP
jgi:hypothetical protein